jgi:hypothetical protein
MLGSPHGQRQDRYGVDRSGNIGDWFALFARFDCSFTLNMDAGKSARPAAEKWRMMTTNLRPVSPYINRNPFSDSDFLESFSNRRTYRLIPLLQAHRECHGSLAMRRKCAAIRGGTKEVAQDTLSVAGRNGQ